MKYKGKELKEFRSTENVAFNPPHQMIVWNDTYKPLTTWVLAYLPSVPYAVATVTGNRFEHCAEILEAKTNWDVYMERHGTPTISLEEAIETFDDYNIPCTFCPARGRCSADDKGLSCNQIFKAWAESEAKK